ncbi:hypothetical protein H5T52_10290 [Candidatus Bipolaricaulota bacterium]|nr:hypothetical protein [Candidatus Bipolaricaulota bacterium]
MKIFPLTPILVAAARKPLLIVRVVYYSGQSYHVLSPQGVDVQYSI